MGEKELEAQVFIRGGEIAHFEFIYFCCYLFWDWGSNPVPVCGGQALCVLYSTSRPWFY